jgi:uncharacterized protein (TIGR03089 family)
VSDTFAGLLARQLGASAGRPLVTFYDDRTRERVELSVATYANWVAKTASLLQDEVGLVHGDRLLVDLPTHWLGPVWLGAAWSLGLVVVAPGGPGPADAVVCGPVGLERYAGAAEVPVVALSLLPMATRFPTPLPNGVLDYGLVVWGQPDAFAAYDPVLPDDPAWEDGAGPLTQAEVMGSGTGAGTGAAAVRLLTDHTLLSRDGLAAFVEPLRSGGGTVWVAEAAPDGWDARAAAEHVTAVLRA